MLTFDLKIIQSTRPTFFQDRSVSQDDRTSAWKGGVAVRVSSCWWKSKQKRGRCNKTDFRPFPRADIPFCGSRKTALYAARDNSLQKTAHFQLCVLSINLIRLFPKRPNHRPPIANFTPARSYRRKRTAERLGAKLMTGKAQEFSHRLQPWPPPSLASHWHCSWSKLAQFHNKTTRWMTESPKPTRKTNMEAFTQNNHFKVAFVGLNGYLSHSTSLGQPGWNFYPRKETKSNFIFTQILRIWRIAFSVAVRNRKQSQPIRFRRLNFPSQTDYRPRYFRLIF